MIEETARVVEVHDGQLVLETVRKTACGGCSSKSECGVSALSGLFRDKTIRLEMRNDINARTGDEVIVGIEEGAFMHMTFLTYLLPLVLALGGAAITSLVTTTQWPVISAAIVSFIIGLNISRSLSKNKFKGALHLRKEKSSFQARPVWSPRL